MKVLLGGRILDKKDDNKKKRVGKKTKWLVAGFGPSSHSKMGSCSVTGQVWRKPCILPHPSHGRKKEAYPPFPIFCFSLHKAFHRALTLSCFQERLPGSFSQLLATSDPGPEYVLCVSPEGMEEVSFHKCVRAGLGARASQNPTTGGRGASETAPSLKRCG